MQAERGVQSLHDKENKNVYAADSRATDTIKKE